MVRSDRQIIQFNRCELWRGSRVEKGKYQRERFTRERGEYIVSLFIFINMNQKIVSIPQLQVSDFFGRQRQTFRNQQISKKRDRKSTRLNSSHVATSYAVFCLKKKKISTTE